MNDFNAIQKDLCKDIDALNRTIYRTLTSDVALINQISQYIVRAGGKRLRPLILILAAKSLNYAGDKHYWLATIIEFIHTATLLHDDVVDRANIRRAQMSANKKWGNSESVLTGDFLYSRAFEMMVEVNSMRVMAILAKTTNTIAEGEVLQLLNRQNTKLDKSAYFRIIENKTACLFEAATQLGAIISQAEPKVEKTLKIYGLNLGNAFQIVDDVLDYKADTQTLGKEIGRDLSEGKTTLPMIYALENATEKDRKFLIHALENSSTKNIERIIHILEKTTAFDSALNQAKICAKKAADALENLENNKFKKMLLALTDLVIKRHL